MGSGSGSPTSEKGEGMVQEVLSVPDVTCSHCVAAIEGAVGGLPSVQSVTVDLDRKDVTIRFDDGQVAREEIVTAIQGEGYEVAHVG
jgi:copper chaperone